MRDTRMVAPATCSPAHPRALLAALVVVVGLLPALTGCVLGPQTTAAASPQSTTATFSAQVTTVTPQGKVYRGGTYKGCLVLMMQDGVLQAASSSFHNGNGDVYPLVSGSTPTAFQIQLTRGIFLNTHRTTTQDSGSSWVGTFTISSEELGSVASGTWNTVQSQCS